MSKLSILVLVGGLIGIHAVSAAETISIKKTVTFIPVQSRVFEGVAYEVQGHALWLWFDRGGVYCYRGVTSDHYRGFLSSDNKGRYFNTHIRSRYVYLKTGQHPKPLPADERPVTVAAR